MSSINQADLELGNSCIAYAVKSVAASIVVAATWSCSTFIGGVLVAALLGSLMYLLALAFTFVLQRKFSDESIASVGGAARRGWNAVTGLFSKKAVAA